MLGAQTWRSPWRAGVLLLGVVALIVLIGLPRLSEPLGRDQGIFAYAGSQILRGKVMHRDIWDHKPAGTHVVYALGLALFGHTSVAVRLTDLLWCVASAGALYWVSRQAFGHAAGVWAALIYGLAYQVTFNWWDRAQTDGWMVLPLALAIYAALQAEERRSAGLYGVAGVCCGLAFWFKPNAAWVALALGILALVRRSAGEGLRRALSLAGGFLGVAAVVVLAYGLLGGLRDLIDAVIGFNMSVHVRPTFDMALGRAWATWTGRFLLKMHLPLALAGCAIADMGRHRPGRRGMIVIAWLFASFLMAWTQWLYFGYHWIPIVAPLAVLAGQGITRLWHWLRPRGRMGEPASRWVARGASLVFFMTSLGVYIARYAPEFRTYWRYQRGELTEESYLASFVRTDFNYGALREVAMTVAEMTQPHDPVLVWGFEPLIAFLADRQMPTRFMFNYPLVGRHGEAFRPEWRDEFLDDIHAQMPAVIVMGERDTNPLKPHSSVQEMEEWPAFQAFVFSHYVLDRTLAGYRLYRLQAP